jgi:hypothetical protein
VTLKPIGCIDRQCSRRFTSRAAMREHLRVAHQASMAERYSTGEEVLAGD